MPDDSDNGLGWLEDEVPNMPSDKSKQSGSDLAEAEQLARRVKDKLSREKDLPSGVEDWLGVGAEDTSDTMVSPDGAAQAFDQSSLDWLSETDAPLPTMSNNAPALLEEDDDRSIEDQAGESMFSQALDEFFESIEEENGEISMVTTAGERSRVTDASRSGTKVGNSTGTFDPSQTIVRRVRDNRIDRIINTLLRYLTRKDPIREEQLDSIFRLTIGRLVDALHAEVVAVYFLNDADQLVVAHVFYSKHLFKKRAQEERAFLEHLHQIQSASAHLDPNTGIIGRCLKSKKPISSLSVDNDPDYHEFIGKDVDFDVRTMLTVPIMYDSVVFGGIQLMNKDANSGGGEFFSFQDSKLVEEIASYSGRIIQRFRDPKAKPSEKEMAEYVARLAKSEVIDLTEDDMEFDVELWTQVGEDHIKKFKIIPLALIAPGRLKIAMANPLDFQRRSSFELATDMRVDDALVAVQSQIDSAIEQVIEKKQSRVGSDEIDDIVGTYEENEGEEVEEIDDIEEEENAAPIIKLANRIIEDAQARGASDIHLEPFEGGCRVRYRIDGVLHEVHELPRRVFLPLVSRVKIMSDLDISERRLPQDGKIKFKKWSRDKLDLDLRVATGPMAFGEKICMRLLVKNKISGGLDGMGFSPKNLELYRWAAAQPYGMILNVGPTGSGKTTTLYSALTEVSTPEVNVHTAEDPIEYPLHGINQMQMQKNIGLTFATALKCFLRMDPDIILVGEIRDLETAEIAVEAAITGHLLFSTLHTNDAATTVTRFSEMGVEPFMISSSLLLVCAQRLARRICKNCREPYELGDKEREILERDPRDFVASEIYRHNPKGCRKCGNASYKGRVGIHEILTLNEEIRELVIKDASADNIKRAARENGMLTMFQDALWKVKGGIIDFDEVFANVKDDTDVKRDTVKAGKGEKNDADEMF